MTKWHKAANIILSPVSKNLGYATVNYSHIVHDPSLNEPGSHTVRGDKLTVCIINVNHGEEQTCKNTSSK